MAITINPIHPARPVSTPRMKKTVEAVAFPLASRMFPFLKLSEPSAAKMMPGTVKRKPGQHSTVAVMLSIIHTADTLVFAGCGADSTAAGGSVGGIAGNGMPGEGEAPETVGAGGANGANSIDVPQHGQKAISSEFALPHFEQYFMSFLPAHV